ncbi:MAG: DUF126 domain-containing protein [Thermofilaceae archaeon]
MEQLIKVHGRGLVEGRATAPLLLSEEPISFYGGVDPDSGKIVEKGHELHGESISGRLLVFPHGKGSTVGSYILLRLAKKGKAPAGIINLQSEPIIIIGCMLGGVPLMDKPSPDPLKLKEQIQGKTARIIVKGKDGLLEVHLNVRNEKINS